jgi:hypothetical protein
MITVRTGIHFNKKIESSIETGGYWSDASSLQGISG